MTRSRITRLSLRTIAPLVLAFLIAAALIVVDGLTDDLQTADVAVVSGNKVEANGQLPIQHSSPMNQQQFWQLIENSRKPVTDCTDEPVDSEHLVDELAKFSEQDIIEFERIFRTYLLAADHYDIMAAAAIIDIITDDRWVYFRCWLIARGEEAYTTVLNRPDDLSMYLTEYVTGDWVGLPDCEDMLYIATEAFGQRVGREEDESFPRNQCPGLDYDFDAVTQGDDWKDEELPTKCPKMWKMFVENNPDHFRRRGS